MSAEPERWEGWVTDVGAEVFTAEIVNSDGDRMTAEFYADKVAEADRGLVEVGATFDVTVDGDGARIVFRRWKPLDLLAMVNPYRVLLDSRELSAIDAARKDGCTWLEIGRALGYTGSEKTISTSGRQRAGRLRVIVATGKRSVVTTARISGSLTPSPRPAETTEPAVDLMAALRASIEAARAGRAPAPERWVAPWTDEQVAALTRRQGDGLAHPYTCPNHEADPYSDDEERLTATRDGWVHSCGYQQDWALPEGEA